MCSKRRQLFSPQSRGFDADRVMGAFSPSVNIILEVYFEFQSYFSANKSSPCFQPSTGCDKEYQQLYLPPAPALQRQKPSLLSAIIPSNSKISYAEICYVNVFRVDHIIMS